MIRRTSDGGTEIPRLFPVVELAANHFLRIQWVYEYAQIAVFDIFLSISIVLGYSLFASSLFRRRMAKCLGGMEIL